MRGFRLTPWLLGIGLVPLLAPASRGQNPPIQPVTWEIAAERQGFVPRSYASDGTIPAVGKGRTPLSNLHLVYLDPTYLAGPAEPGSATPVKAAIKPAKPRVGPLSSGYAFTPRCW